MRRSLLRRFGTVAACLLLLAWVLEFGHVLYLEQALEHEVVELRTEGLLDRERADESPDLVSARQRLEEILRRIHDADEEGRFGAPWMQRADQAERLAAGLAERAGLLAELDGLPTHLWCAPREPSRSPRQRAVREGERLPSNSMVPLRSAMNLLCGQAWHAAREPEGAAEAGYRLGLALALARTVDNGGGIELAFRCFGEGMVVGTYERLLAEGVVDPALLSAPLLWEIARDDRADPVRIAVESELAHVVDALERGADLWSGFQERGDRLGELRLSIACVRALRAQLQDDLTALHREPLNARVPAGPWFDHFPEMCAYSRDWIDDFRMHVFCAGPSPRRS